MRTRIAMTTILSFAAVPFAAIAGQNGDREAYIYSCGKAAEKFGFDGFKDSPRTATWGGRDPSPEAAADIKKGKIPSVRITLRENGLVTLAHMEPSGKLRCESEYRVGASREVYCYTDISERYAVVSFERLLAKNKGLRRLNAILRGSITYNTPELNLGQLFVLSVVKTTDWAFKSADDYARFYMEYVQFKKLHPFYWASKAISAMNEGEESKNDELEAKDVTLLWIEHVLDSMGSKQLEFEPLYFCAGDMDYQMTPEWLAKYGAYARTVRDVADALFEKIPQDQRVEKMRKLPISRSAEGSF